MRIIKKISEIIEALLDIQKTEGDVLINGVTANDIRITVCYENKDKKIQIYKTNMEK